MNLLCNIELFDKAGIDIPERRTYQATELHVIWNNRVSISRKRHGGRIEVLLRRRIVYAWVAADGDRRVDGNRSAVEVVEPRIVAGGKRGQSRELPAPNNGVGKAIRVIQEGTALAKRQLVSECHVEMVPGRIGALVIQNVIVFVYGVVEVL